MSAVCGMRRTGARRPPFISEYSIAMLWICPIQIQRPDKIGTWRRPLSQALASSTNMAVIVTQSELSLIYVSNQSALGVYGPVSNLSFY